MNTSMSEQSTGRLYGVGLGPGDPSLMTVRAVEVIAQAQVIAFHSARHGRSIARSIAAGHIRADHIEEPLVYPVTTETTDHPGGYRGAMEEFYAEAAARLAAHLDAGRTVAVLAEGDPLFYGSYMHMHKRLADRYPTEVIPGVTSVSAAAARLGVPLVEGEEVLTILPGTLPEEELTARLASTDSAVVMKLGRTFPAVHRAIGRSGRMAEARYVERATMPGERTGELADVEAGSVPYFSVAVLPSRVGAPEPVREHGDVVVVGTGPAGPLWLTPESRGRWPPPTTWSATPRIWTAARSGPGSDGTAPTTRWSRSAPSSLSNWPGAAGRSPWSRVVIPGCSPWRPPCWRSRPRTCTAMFRCACCRASPPPTRLPPGRVRRWATTTPRSRSPTGSSRGR